jgi:hypothetical protein
MPNFTGSTPSINGLILANANYNSAELPFSFTIPATVTLLSTQDVSTASSRRYPALISCPSYSNPCLGYIVTNCSVFGRVDSFVIGLEYLLGSINIGTGVFTPGVVMPTKTIRGESIVTASNIVMANINTAVSGTAVSLTMTYTNDNGVSNRTAFINNFPTSIAVNSAFNIIKNVQTGDYGIRSIQNITKIGGTSGVIDFYGILPLAYVNSSGGTGFCSAMTPLTNPIPAYLFESDEKIGIYSTATTTGATIIFGSITIVPEV